MATAKKRSFPTRLSFRSAEQVVVEAENEDRFVMTEREAARACHLAHNDEQSRTQWRKEFVEMLKYVADWAAQQAKVKAVFLAVGGDGLELFVTTEGSEYRPEMDAAIAELDIQLVTQFPSCPTDTMHFPSQPIGRLDVFFDTDEALQVWPPKSST